MKIDLRIDRLIVDGLPVTAAQGPRLRAAVERELARRLATGGLSDALAGGGALARIGAPDLHLERDVQPAQLGRRIAEAVHGAIGGPGKQTPAPAPHSGLKGDTL